MTDKIRIAVAGCNGRMGHCLIQAIKANSESCVLTAATEAPGSSVLGCDAGELAGTGKSRVMVTDDPEKVVDDFDVIIDFTRPEPSIKNLETAVKYHKMVVLGTTGFNEEQLQSPDF